MNPKSDEHQAPFGSFPPTPELDDPTSMYLRFKNSFHSKPRRQISVSFDILEFLACGKLSVVHVVDDKTVLEYADTSDGEDIVEQQAYTRLGSHPNIAEYIGSTANGSILLKRGQVLRCLCQQASANEISLQRKLRWLLDFAKGQQYAQERDYSL